MSYWQSQKGMPVVDLGAAHAFVIVPRTRLVCMHRADARFDQMMAEGAMEEV